MGMKPTYGGYNAMYFGIKWPFGPDAPIRNTVYPQVLTYLSWLFKEPPGGRITWIWLHEQR